MEKKQIEEILKSETDRNSLDTAIVNLLLVNYEEIASKVKAKQAASRGIFEAKFLGIQKKDDSLLSQGQDYL